MQYRIIDDFISEDDLVKIEQNVLQASIFKAYESTAFQESDDVYDVMMNRVFFSPFYDSRTKPICDQEYLPYFYPIIDRISDLKVLLRVSLNLTFATPEPNVSQFHIDNYIQNSFTNIFYLNSNNGGTKFEKSGDVVQSQRNRLVMFPSFLKHAAVNTTDTKLRWVLNINYVAT
tara:strand:- start:44 stop:565 length:522 start_codon:yes stop_codon:yes gene_type:complete